MVSRCTFKNLPNEYDLANTNLWSNFDVVQFMQLLLLLVSPQFLDEEQENSIAEYDQDNQHGSIILVLVYHESKAVPFQEECKHQNASQQFDVLSYWDFPVLKQEVCLFQSQLIADNFFIGLNHVAMAVKQNVWLLELLQSQKLVVCE